jgi:hypothetical protein
MKRFRCCTFTIKPNESPQAFQVIDTSKLYEKVSAVYIPDNKPLNSVNKTYLKFYANGRLGVFYAYDKENPASLNPKNADMGFYNFSDGKFTIQTHFDHPQGGGFIKDELEKMSEAKIALKGGDILSVYSSLTIPKTHLIFKPDW